MSSTIIYYIDIDTLPWIFRNCTIFPILLLEYLSCDLVLRLINIYCCVFKEVTQKQLQNEMVHSLSQSLQDRMQR
jgi:hypothetical protein